MKIMMKLLLAATALTVAVPAMAQNIVNNSGFENGFTGWYGNMTSFTSPGSTHTGTGVTASGCVGSFCTSTYNSGVYFGQALTTVAGQAYNLSFWVAESGGPTSEFSVFWQGALVNLTQNFNNDSFDLNTGDPSYRQFNLNGLIANGTSTDLQIHGRHDPAAIYFDDISVVQAAGAVPETATWGMMIAGFGMMGAAMRTRRRSTKVMFA